jgi:hypothetical protein
MSDVWLWVLAGAGTFFGLLGCAWARRAARRLDQLNHSYWELRYQHGQLRAQVNRLDPEHHPEPDPASAGRQAENFIPLSSLKR